MPRSVINNPEASYLSSNLQRYFVPSGNCNQQSGGILHICCQIFKGILWPTKTQAVGTHGIQAIVIEILSQIDFISSYMGLVIFVSTFLQIREQDVRMQGIQAMLKEMSHQIEFQQSNQNIHLIVLSNIKKKCTTSFMFLSRAIAPISCRANVFLQIIKCISSNSKGREERRLVGAASKR